MANGTRDAAGAAFTIETATVADLEIVRRLLATAGLPSSDVGGARQIFLVARAGAQVIGCVGLEMSGTTTALLRSLAVVHGKRDAGVGGALCDALLDLARRHGVVEAYLLTTDAEPYFARRGFVRVARDDFPQALRDTEEFASFCATTAVCMRRLVAA